MKALEYIQGNQDVLEKLKKIPALRSFEEEEIKELLLISRLQEYQDGEMIIEEGQFDKRVYYLVSGHARIVKQEKELVVLKRTGDVFGEMGVVTGAARTASVYAKGGTLCLVTDVSKLDSLSKGDKLVFRYMLYRTFAEILANRLKVTTEELISAREEIEVLREKSHQ